MRVTVSEKGWVVIPAALRKKYNLHPGAEVAVVDYGGVLALVPAMATPVRQAAGMLKGRHRSLVRCSPSTRQSARVAGSPAAYVLDSFALLAYLEGEAGTAPLSPVAATRTCTCARSSWSVRTIEASRSAQPRAMPSIISCSHSAPRRIGTS
jgi:AbrB family looped-hinge helix DNA binding protein